MTNGTSQGLFVVVAIVIFGISVLVSYLLFRDTLNPNLSTIFEDSLTHADNVLNGIENIKAHREDETYLYAKVRDADTAKGETEIWVKALKNADETLTLYQSSTKDDNYSWGRNEMTGSLSLPDCINGRKIVAIGEKTTPFNTFQYAWFDGEIKLPKYLTIVGARAFYYSKFEGTLNLPSSLTYIGKDSFTESVFSGKLLLPQKLLTIENNAFYSSTFSKDLFLPESLKRIGNSSFNNSIFTGELKLTKNLTELGQGAFWNSKFSGTLNVANVNYIQRDVFRSSKISKVIRGTQSMSPIHYPNNTEGIHPESIRLLNGQWYNGTND